LIAYFDTSAVIPLVVDETGSEQANRLWDEADRVVAARLLYAEARAALALADRMDRISGPALRRGVAALERLYEQMDKVETSEVVVRRAGVLAETHALRGYDAIHLASAETLVNVIGAVFVAGDRSLCRAATAIGLAVGRLP
jgi:uncharacterized protein